MNKIVYLIIVTSFFFTSCCTLTRGTKQEVLVTSNPAGASIEIDGYDCGQTPQTFLLARKSDHQILVSNEHEAQSFILKSQISPYSTINLTAPLVGAGVGAGAGLIATGGSLSGLEAMAPILFGVAGLAVGAAIALTGVGTDLFSGSAYTLDYSRVHADLQ
jgi:PEGA domain